MVFPLSLSFVKIDVAAILDEIVDYVKFLRLQVKIIATHFIDIVNPSHSFATGGTPIDEHWKEPVSLASYLNPLNEESCTTYNMLKVSRNFRWTKEMAYADHYKPTLINGVLSILKETEPGVMIYCLPLGPGNTKAVSRYGWGTPFESIWCCYGTNED